MTDLTISLSAEAAARLAREAEQRGVSADKVAAELVEAWMADDEIDVEDDLRRLAEVGDNIDAKTAFAELRAEIEKARSAKS